MSMQTLDHWTNCYPSAWKGIITPEAFQHPAKFSSRLIERIYQHAIEEGWLTSGDRVVDPFGGVALGAFPALRTGLDWTGCELEPRFVELGNANINLWNTRYANKLPKWGTARLVQGDSRELLKVINAAECAVSSPPYADGCAHTGGDDPQGEYLEGGTYHGVGINGVVSSPPYSESNQDYKDGWKYIDKQKLAESSHDRYSQYREADYGLTPGQLGAMPAGDYQATISSPPFEKSVTVKPADDDYQRARMIARGRDPNSVVSGLSDGYGMSEGQIGNSDGDTFWTAARAILEQTYAVLTPGAHAIWVVKGYVKNKQLVDFPGQWQAVCEAVGFTTLHEHHAMLVNHRGTSLTLDGGEVEHKTESKSFFRRLAEKNGSPRIDWETVLCMVKGTA